VAEGHRAVSPASERRDYDADARRAVRRREGCTVGAHRYDAIVIGGGHNGLTSAAYLARAGLSTVVLERRDLVGGACVTEEIAPGVRASTTSYIASMLRPEVIRDLRLSDHGLKVVPCQPALQVAFEDGDVFPWWSEPDRAAAEFGKRTPEDRAAFFRTDEELKRLARYLQPFFLEEPPDIYASGLGRLRELTKLGRRFWRIRGQELAAMVDFLTSSLKDYLDATFVGEKSKRMFLANNTYGAHASPYRPGSASALLFHLLSGGDDEVQGFYGHVIGGMGSIAEAMAAAARGFGADVRTSAPVANVITRNGRAVGVALEDGTEFHAKVVLSNADPKRTFLRLVDPSVLPEEFVHQVEHIVMDGPCAKVCYALSEEPRVNGMPDDADPNQRSLFTLVPTLEAAERSYDAMKYGELTPDLWVDCVVASNVDPTLAPEGTHVMTCFVQYVPFRLREGTWDGRREELGDHVEAVISRYAPNVPGSVIARKVITPLDLERTYGLTEGNIFHGDLRLEQLFSMRPVPGWANYRTPLEGLYLCGCGAHPGGGVTGAPGYNAAHRVLKDMKARR
jgi:phytoene dehydrogenase-like protein